MSSRGSVLHFALLALLILSIGCAGNGTPRSDRADSGNVDKLRVYVVNYPLQYFAERIGGEQVQVEFPAPRDVDPAYWRPDAETVSRFQEADLVLLNGADYAKWVQGVSLPSAALVDTSEAYHERLIRIANIETHAHGPQGEHEHGGFACTTWLDMRNAVEQARAIEAAFVGAMPRAATQFRSRRELLERDLMELDGDLRKVAANLKAPLLGSHPVYQYLAQGYDLAIASVHFEPDEFPDDRGWRDLSALLEAHPARWMLWEGNPLPETARKLQTLGVESVVFDPCGNRPEVGDFLTAQRKNLERMRQVQVGGT